jgi:hypothetical protein
VPQVSDPSWVKTPVDAFVLARLRAEGLAPAPPADRRTLLRRVYFDLIGLPPTPEEVEAFLQDESPGAYERVVDELLARPQYGERWARHWLDVVRYAESNGYERDGAKPSAWRYRDYVINSFNRDKPYDRFVTEQLAGDELPDATAETQIATTFLRLGTWDDEPAEPMVDRCDQLDDVLGTTATALLGLTLRCARCHDHKFEPFTQVDYYRMLAVFQPLKRPQNGRTDLDRAVGTPAELSAYREEVTRRAAGLAAPLRLAPAWVRLADLPPAPPRAYIWYEDSPRAPATHVLQRGDPEKRGAEVQPGFPAALAPEQPQPPGPTDHSTGRRLWLARWLTRPDHPLTARVMVNRVWQHHFGNGLVGSENDFGLMGEAPSHPELLDWLAGEFVAGGWRLKPLHRLLVLSNTYQMSAAPNPAAAEKDPDNHLLWRWRQRRLSAEAVRDAILAVSGRLNPEAGGPSVFPTLPRPVLEGQSRPGDGWGKSDERQASRRSIYIFVKRSLAVPELDLLDAPDTTSSCEQRPVSTTGPQALTFLNGAFTHEQARHFARRLLREAGPDPAAQVDRAFRLALARPPRPEELAAARGFLDRQRRLLEKEAPNAPPEAPLAALGVVLFNTNEFVYWN